MRKQSEKSQKAAEKGRSERLAANQKKLDEANAQRAADEEARQKKVAAKAKKRDAALRKQANARAAAEKAAQAPAKKAAKKPKASKSTKPAKAKKKAAAKSAKTKKPASPTAMNINEASAEQLIDSGLAPALAEKVVAARPFKDAADLTRVKGIGKVLAAGLSSGFSFG